MVNRMKGIYYLSLNPHVSCIQTFPRAKHANYIQRQANETVNNSKRGKHISLEQTMAESSAARTHSLLYFVTFVPW